MLLHVIDASDPRRDERIDQVNAVLDEVGAGDLPQIRVYNKIDRLDLTARTERNADGEISSVWISAAARLGLVELMEAIAERLSRHASLRHVRVDAGHAGALRARLFAVGVVRTETVLADGALELLASLPEALAQELARIPGVSIDSASDLVQPCALDGGYLQSALSARPS